VDAHVLQLNHGGTRARHGWGRREWRVLQQAPLCISQASGDDEHTKRANPICIGIKLRQSARDSGKKKGGAKAARLSSPAQKSRVPGERDGRGGGHATLRFPRPQCPRRTPSKTTDAIVTEDAPESPASSLPSPQGSEAPASAAISHTSFRTAPTAAALRITLPPHARWNGGPRMAARG